MPERQEQIRVPEHLRYRDRQIIYQPLEAFAVMKHFILERRYGLYALRMDMMPNSPAEGGDGIVAEVIAVKAMDAFQQQLDLDLLQLLAVIFSPYF